MSEKVGSDIERLRILMITYFSIVLKSFEYDIIKIRSRFMSDPTFSDIDYKK